MKSFIITFSLIFIINTTYAQHVRFDPNPVNFPTGSEVDFAGIGDINGDGLNDIVGATTFAFNGTNNYSLVLWLQGANGQMQQPLFFKHPFPGVISCLAVSNLGRSSSKSSGNAEVVVGLRTDDNSDVYIYSWDGNGLVATDSFTTSTRYAPDGVIGGDFDNDGLTDIGVSHWGDSIVVIFQNNSNPTWEVKKYAVTTNGYGHITSGQFGAIQKTTLIATNGQGNTGPVILLYFDAARSLQSTHHLKLPAHTSPPYDTPTSAYSAVIVNKGNNKANELWVTYGGNKPRSKVAIWRGIQQLPDSTFPVYDLPEAIASANLDCDDGDEQVIVHAAWMRASVIADSIYPYKIFDAGHYYQEGVVLGDVNNDGFADMCLAHERPSGDLQVLYNITPPCKWPDNIPETKVVVGKIDIYPNPASAETTIAYNGTGELRVYNIQGSIVSKSQLNKRSVLNTSGWPAGLYIITLHTGSSIVSEKLVIH